MASQFEFPKLPDFGLGGSEVSDLKATEGPAVLRGFRDFKEFQKDHQQTEFAETLSELRQAFGEVSPNFEEGIQHYAALQNGERELAEALTPGAVRFIQKHVRPSLLSSLTPDGSKSDLTSIVSLGVLHPENVRSYLREVARIDTFHWCLAFTAAKNAVEKLEAQPKRSSLEVTTDLSEISGPDFSRFPKPVSGSTDTLQGSTFSPPETREERLARGKASLDRLLPPGSEGRGCLEVLTRNPTWSDLGLRETGVLTQISFALGFDFESDLRKYLESSEAFGSSASRSAAAKHVEEILARRREAEERQKKAAESRWDDYDDYYDDDPPRRHVSGGYVAYPQPHRPTSVWKSPPNEDVYGAGSATVGRGTVGSASAGSAASGGGSHDPAASKP